MAAKAEQKQIGFRSIFASLMAPTCRMSHLQKSCFSVKKGTALVDVFVGEKHSLWFVACQRFPVDFPCWAHFSTLA